MANKTIVKRNAKLKLNKKELSTTNKITNFWIPFSLMIPALIFFLFFTIYPLIDALDDATTEPIRNFDNYFQSVWTDNKYWIPAVQNSLIYASVSLPFSLMISLVISASITSLVREKAKGFWQTLFFIPYVTSAIAVSLTFAQLFSSSGLINRIFHLDGVGWLITPNSEGKLSLVTVIIYGIWHSLAFQILILSTAMLSVDKRLYDAANIDGASSSKIFFNVTLPSIERTIWYVFTIGLIGAVKVFPLALFGNDPHMALERAPSMLIYIYYYVQQGDAFSKGKAAAASISLIIIIIAYSFLVRRGTQIVRWTINFSSIKFKQMKIDGEINKTKRLNYKSINKGGRS